MGEAYIKAASITGKYDPPISASVLQTEQAPFIKTWGQALLLMPWYWQVNSRFGQWSTSQEVWVPLWLPDTSAVSPQLDPRKHPSHITGTMMRYTKHQEHEKLAGSQLRLLCGFGKITLSFCFSSPQLRWRVLARSVTFPLYYKTPAFQEISQKPLKRAHRAQHQGPQPSYNQLPHFFFFLFYILRVHVRLHLGKKGKKKAASCSKKIKLGNHWSWYLLFLTLKT